MNFDKLALAQADFFERFPGGFSHPDIMVIAKKHKMDKMVSFAQEAFSEVAFEDPDLILENLTKLISRSSLISIFEKPRFKDFVFSLSGMDRQLLVDGLRDYLHGNQQKGFEMMAQVLASGKLAKWSLMTVAPCYFNPQHEVFIKPTTAKGILSYFELDSFKYHAIPTWPFYSQFRTLIHELKGKVAPELASSNVAFCGFLMMSLPRDV